MDDLLHGKQPGGRGYIVGLTKKDGTVSDKDATVKANGFYLNYDPKTDGDTVTIKDQATFVGRKLGGIRVNATGEGVASDNRLPSPRDPGASDTSLDDIAFSNRFDSPLARGFQTARQESMPAPQWILWLGSNKGNLGIKDDEVFPALAGMNRATALGFQHHLRFVLNTVRRVAH